MVHELLLVFVFALAISMFEASAQNSHSFVSHRRSGSPLFLKIAGQTFWFTFVACLFCRHMPCKGVASLLLQYSVDVSLSVFNFHSLGRQWKRPNTHQHVTSLLLSPWTAFYLHIFRHCLFSSLLNIFLSLFLFVLFAGREGKGGRTGDDGWTFWTGDDDGDRLLSSLSVLGRGGGREAEAGLAVFHSLRRRKEKEEAGGGTGRQDRTLGISYCVVMMNFFGTVHFAVWPLAFLLPACF